MEVFCESKIPTSSVKLRYSRRLDKQFFRQEYFYSLFDGIAISNIILIKQVTISRSFHLCRAPSLSIVPLTTLLLFCTQSASKEKSKSITAIPFIRATFNPKTHLLPSN